MPQSKRKGIQSTLTILTAHFLLALVFLYRPYRKDIPVSTPVIHRGDDRGGDFEPL